jgi:23S rRNA pseudouridine2605 synthase
MNVRGKVPLERAISKLGITSRSLARKAILEKKVKVNGRVISEPEYLIFMDKVKITIEGFNQDTIIPLTIMLNKPKGLVTTRSDEKNRATVYECLKEITTYIAPVGRLDQHSTGLLIFTNDTKLSDFLTNPKNQLEKTYVVVVDGKFTEDQSKVLVGGIEDQGEFLIASSVEILKTSNRESTVKIILKEGKNREIRRLMKHLGFEVTKLKRIAIGKLELGELETGQWQELSTEEIYKNFPNFRQKD